LLEELPKIAAQQRKAAEAERDPALAGDMQTAARSGMPTPPRFS
jgi:hypothetical protein